MPKSPLLGAISAFATYRSDSSYAVRSPDLATKQSDDELVLLSGDHGVRELDVPPAEGVQFAMPPSPNDKYIWVINPCGLPCSLERLPDIVAVLPGLAKRSGRISHTNLSGGQDAHSGGEMWFPNDKTIILNGGSGRYPPRSANELADIVLAFRACGWRTASMGWDTETNFASRVLRGVPQWE